MTEFSQKVFVRYTYYVTAPYIHTLKVRCHKQFDKIRK